jgi:hypothetical protein
VICTFLQKKERKKRRQEIDVQAVSRFVLKQRISKTTIYTSNKNLFKKKRKRGKEEERKKEEKRRGRRERKRGKEKREA